MTMNSIAIEFWLWFVALPFACGVIFGALWALLSRLRRQRGAGTPIARRPAPDVGAGRKGGGR